MSFSGKVKEELLEHYARARHCDIAELSAIVHMAGEFKVGHGGVCCLKVHTENLGVARKCFTLLVKTFNIKTDVVVRRNTGKDNYSYYIYAKGEELLAIRDTIVHLHIRDYDGLDVGFQGSVLLLLCFMDGVRNRKWQFYDDERRYHVPRKVHTFPAGAGCEQHCILHLLKPCNLFLGVSPYLHHRERDLLGQSIPEQNF